jgi:hypothetical protein
LIEQTPPTKAAGITDTAFKHEKPNKLAQVLELLNVPGMFPECYRNVY